jgi:hypothetical protein
MFMRKPPEIPDSNLQHLSAAARIGSGRLGLADKIERSCIERRRLRYQGRAASPRMTGASAEEEIDESAGKFLRPRSDIASFVGYLSRAN